MTEEQIPSGTRDGTGSGDHDSLHVWGQWRVCLSPIQQARLTILRGYVKDHTGAIAGDSDYVETTPSGLFVPIVTRSDDT